MVNIFKILILLLAFFLPLGSYASGFNELCLLIEEEMNQALVEISQNPKASLDDKDKLQSSLVSIINRLSQEGASIDVGNDAEERPPYVVMQGMIESALTKALLSHSIKNIKMFIIAPRMPTPLMLQETKSLSEIDFTQPQDLAKYRNSILIQFLQAGGTLNAIYAHDAKGVLAETQAEAIETYHSFCENYANLLDLPEIEINIQDFPVAMTGALYNLDGEYIVIESKQVAQIDNALPQTWAIRFGEHAIDRVNEIQTFLMAHGTGQIVL